MIFRNFLKLLCPLLISVACSVIALPTPKTKYDQSQQGELNVRADLENILILFVPSGGIRLVDNQQIGNILQIFSNSRKNPLPESGTTLSTNTPSDSPYKVDIEQSAIDKLQSEVDSLNSVIPITKNYNIEKKENDEIPLDKTEDKELILIPETTVKQEDVSTPAISTKPEVMITELKEKIIESEPIKKTETTKLPTTSKLASMVQDITTVESIVTSQPVVQQKIDKKETIDTEINDKSTIQIRTTTKDEKTSPTVINPTHKVQQKAPTQQRSQNVRPAHASSNSRPSLTVPTPGKSTKVLNDDPNEKRLKLVQSGISHCSPGERLAETGKCVEIPAERESRQEGMDRLLSLLRFGVFPADGSQ